MKKQILCALSVTALAAAMFTAPVYAADPITVEGESEGVAAVLGDDEPFGGGQSYRHSKVTLADGATTFTAMDICVGITDRTSAVALDNIIKRKGLSITYSVDIETAGYYNMDIDMAGYVRDAVPDSRYMPVELQIDSNEAFRLACAVAEAGYVETTTDESGLPTASGVTMDPQPKTTLRLIKRIQLANVDTKAVGTAGTPSGTYYNHGDPKLANCFNSYRVIDPQTNSEGIYFTQGPHKVKFIFSKLQGNDTVNDKGQVVANLRGKFLLDKFVLTPVVEPEPEAPVVKVLEAFGDGYDQESGTAEFTATGLELSEISRLVFAFDKDESETEYKYYNSPIIASGEGSANIAVRLSGIEKGITGVRLAVSDFKTED